jgi:hypothetical protein
MDMRSVLPDPQERLLSAKGRSPFAGFEWCERGRHRSFFAMILQRSYYNRILIVEVHFSARTSGVLTACSLLRGFGL